MSLDAFMKRGKTPAKPETSPETKPKEEKPLAKARLEKHILKCPNPQCKHERVVAKAKILRNDLVCPKCGTLMKERKQRAHKQATNAGADEEGDEAD